MSFKSNVLKVRHLSGVFYRICRYFNVVVNDAQLVDAQRHPTHLPLPAPRADIKHDAMRGAGDHAVTYTPARQGLVLMRALILYGKEFAIRIADQNVMAFDLHCLGRPHGQICATQYSLKRFIAHVVYRV
jgi:hypothetical protein